MPTFAIPDSESKTEEEADPILVRWTAADLIASLDDVPPHRILLDPFPGNATERDLLDARKAGVRCELVNGTLVEKPMGSPEGFLAATIVYFLMSFTRQRRLGAVSTSDGLYRMIHGNIREPDVSFTRRDRLPNPMPQIGGWCPDLCVEVLSPTNTRAEMARKRKEYFSSGCRLVWQFDKKDRSAEVFTNPDTSIRVESDGVLDGGDVLPGFTLPMAELFAEFDDYFPPGPMTERDFATDVVRTLQAAGHVAYFAGGCVRDELLGLTPADYDVATDAVPERVQQLFRRTIAIGAAFGVIEVLGPRVNDEHINVQVATFRSDGSYTDGRRPDAVTFGTPEADAGRRDFTINGFFFDPVADRLYDFVGGRTDLEAKILRAIGDPAARFAEDKLRVLRAVRLAARFDLNVDTATLLAGQKTAHEITVVSAERIAEELRKMLAHPSRGKAVEWLIGFDLVQPILPEISPNIEWRKKVLSLLPESAGFELSLAALLFELEKKSAESVCRRLRLSTDETRYITWLVANRAALAKATEQPPSKLYPVLAHPLANDLITLSRNSALVKKYRPISEDYCSKLIRDTPREVLDPTPLLTGDDLTVAGYKPGPGYKGWLEAVRAAQLDGEVKSKEEALALVARLSGLGNG